MNSKERIEKNQEIINLIENFLTFLAANGYIDYDYHDKPPYPIDEFLTITQGMKPINMFEFVEWIGDSYVKNPTKIVKGWIDKSQINSTMTKIYTTSELYELFKKHKQA